jgi:arsenite methyltransferase
MPTAAVVKILIRELGSGESASRCNEPDLIMDDPAKVAAYTRAGREDGVMAPVYLFHCAQVCEVIRPGDTVLDLGCGPATQLTMVSRLNPTTRFVGLDLSDEMLERARQHVADLGLANVELRQGDITRLEDFSDQSVDAVMSTLVLHHLPDGGALERTFAEVARVLKPGGGLYIVDFGHLKSEKSIKYFAYQYADRQPELFTLDYLYSLRAAFSLQDFRRLADNCLKGRAKLYSTFLMPYMVAIKSPARAEPNPNLSNELRKLKAQLPGYHKRDLADLRTFFRLGGLRSPLLG